MTKMERPKDYNLLYAFLIVVGGGGLGFWFFAGGGKEMVMGWFGR